MKKWFTFYNVNSIDFHTWNPIHWWITELKKKKTLFWCLEGQGGASAASSSSSDVVAMETNSANNLSSMLVLSGGEGYVDFRQGNYPALSLSLSLSLIIASYLKYLGLKKMNNKRTNATIGAVFSRVEPDELQETASHLIVWHVALQSPIATKSWNNQQFLNHWQSKALASRNRLMFPPPPLHFYHFICIHRTKKTTQFNCSFVSISIISITNVAKLGLI